MNVIVIGDTQAPFHHKNYVDFLSDIKKKYKCTQAVHIGDELDFHQHSKYVKDPEAMGIMREYTEGIKFMKQLYKLFPKAKACVSNHTIRPWARAAEVGIPHSWMKSYRELLQAPRGWQWSPRWEIDNVIYEHGVGKSGANGHVKAAEKNRQSTCIGHLHAHLGVKYLASHSDLIFGMNVGCGIDINAYAFKYGMFTGDKPTLGCGVVIDGFYAYPIPMNLGSHVKRG